jgi:hypothetical protein
MAVSRLFSCPEYPLATRGPALASDTSSCKGVLAPARFTRTNAKLPYIYIYMYVYVHIYIYIYMALSRLLPCPERALSARSIRRSAVASATRAGRPSSRHSIANERLQGVGAQTHQTLSEAYTHTCVYVYVWVSTTSFSGGALRRFGLGICGPS